MSDNPTAMELHWEGDQRFRASEGGVSMTLDGNRTAGPSPVQAVAFALGGCMAIDLVDILQKGRLDLKALRCVIEIERAPEPPRRITAARMRFVLTGDIPADRVARAIELSREKYCSVWHSMNPNITFQTAFEIATA